MKAIRISEHGGPEVMRLEELPTPAPGAGQVLVRVEAAGVNFIDTYQRSGQYTIPLPYTMGLEGAGTVEATGDATVTAIAKARAWPGPNVPGGVRHPRARPGRQGRPLRRASRRSGAAASSRAMTAHTSPTPLFPCAAGDACLSTRGGGWAAADPGPSAPELASSQRSHEEGKAASPGRRRRRGDPLPAGKDFKDRGAAVTDGKGSASSTIRSAATRFEKSLDSLAPRGLLALFGQSSGAVPPSTRRCWPPGIVFFTRQTLAHYVATARRLARAKRRCSRGSRTEA